MSIVLISMLAIPALAQEDTTTDSEIIESQEAVQDEIVTEEDLGAQTPGRFNFFKRFTRSIQKAITQDPIKKAEFDIESAHEQLLLAKKIATENPDDPKSAEKVEKALEKFESNIEKVENRAEDIKEKRADQAGAFMEKIADMQIKQQKMLDNLEGKLPEQAFEKVELARTRALEHASEIFTKVAQNKEQISQRMNSAMEKQEGSSFSEFKNMEIMERLREHMSEETKTAIDEVQAKARIRFEENIGELTNKERGEKFNNYIENIKGNAVQQLKVLEEIKTEGKIPQGFSARIEEAKENALMRFEEKMEKFENPAQKEMFMKNLENGDISNLKVMQQIREHAPDNIKKQIQEKEEQATTNLKNKIEATENPEVFERLNKEINANYNIQKNIQKQNSDFSAKLETKRLQIEEIKMKLIPPENLSPDNVSLEKKDEKFCTMEYNPVCGVNGKTYPNACSAESQAKVKIAYKGECKTETKEPIDNIDTQNTQKTPLRGQ